MTYMSRVTFVVAILLSSNSFSLWAETPAVVGRGPGEAAEKAACLQIQYAKKLSELQTQYEDCTQRYVTHMAQNPKSQASVAACGNPPAFQGIADTFAKDLCDKLCLEMKGTGEAQLAFNDAEFKRLFGTDMVTNDSSNPDHSGGTACGFPGLPDCPASPDPAVVGDRGAVKPPVPADPISRAKAEADPARETAEGGDRSPSPASTDKEEANNTSAATPQDPGPAQYEAQNDLNLAQSSQSSANRCCNNPQSCAGVLTPNDQQSLGRMMQTANTQPKEGQGLSEYCAQMKSTTSSGAGINNYMSSICNSQKSSCESTCDSLLTKYQSLYNSCAGCASSQIYSSTYNSIKSIRNSCSALAGRASQLAQQSGSNAYSGGYASACQDFAGTPQGMDFGNPQDKEKDSATSANCLANPNGPGCGQTQLAVKESTDSAGEAGFGDTKTEKTNFNLQDTNDIPGLSAYLPKGVQPQAVTNGTIANNSGGAIPGGSASPASLPPKSGSSPGSPGYDTDILRGTSSPSGGGGGSSGYAQLAGDPRLMDGRWQPMSNSESSSLVGMDLKQYLPGASLDPHRQIAGISAGSQINRKEENIWRIISNKMYEKCKLGVLWRCGPE